ncbi:hypothetical protein [Streptomyces sp. NPDC059072]|uniref:hypothetical protein n=1 Tax=Streptomyces sp. NPDC059072 TaxID=3346715 RepID=UPI00368A1154
MSESGPDGRSSSPARRAKRLIAVVISLGAVAAAVVHVVKPEVKIDGVTLALAAIAVVPWLGDLFESIELPGGTKLQYRRLEERVEAAEQRTDEVRQAVGDAARQARVALVTSGGGRGGGTSAEAEVRELVHQYAELRRTQPSGSARTLFQERIFAELVRVTPYVDDFDVSAALRSRDGGTRLTAYARLHARPEPGRLGELVATAVEEGLPFSQYWAFRAVGTVVDELGADNVSLGTIRTLRMGLARIPADSDRAMALLGVLARLEDLGRRR